MNLKQMAAAFPTKGTKGLGSEKHLMSPWGELALKSDIPLSEYPRPQLVRENPYGDYLILNGIWNYAIVDSRRLPKEWDGKIRVPFSPETGLSGVNRQLMPGQCLWYEKIIHMDEIRSDRRYLLHFGAVDQFCQVFLNGKRIVRHEGGYLPFTGEVTDRLKTGDNILRICVEDLSDTSYLTRGKQRLKRGGMFYTAQSGIWQTVWLESLPLQYIERVKIRPVFDEHMLDISVCINGSYNFGKAGQVGNMRSRLGIILYEPEFVGTGGFRKNLLRRLEPELEYISLDESRREYHTRIEVTDVRYWTPEMPWLYGLTLSFEEDQVFSYTALRQVNVEADGNKIPRICLNRKPCFMNGLLDQGYWPESLMTAPADDALIFDIETAKQAGFNMLRLHCKLESDRFYYHCDRLGMLVWQDMVNGGSSYNMIDLCYLPTIMPFPFQKRSDSRKSLWKKTGRSRFRSRRIWLDEMEQTIRLLYNHPSIVCWVLFNEGWGQFDVKKALESAKKSDETRLIDAASGWFDQQNGDMKSIHNYFRPLKVEKDERAFVISEYGGLAYRLKEHSFSEKFYGYGVIRDRFSFNRAFLEKQSRIRSLIPEGLCAAVYTQLSDIEEEVNGIMTYDRRVIKIRLDEKENAG